MGKKLSFAQKNLMAETQELRQTQIELKGEQASNHLKGLGLRVVSLPSGKDSDVRAYQAKVRVRETIKESKKPLKQNMSIDLNKMKVA